MTDEIKKWFSNGGEGPHECDDKATSGKNVEHPTVKPQVKKSQVEKPQVDKEEK